MSIEHEAPYTAGEVIQDMQARGIIPSKPPAPDRKHRVAEVLAYVLSGACLGLAAIMFTWLFGALIGQVIR